MTGNEEVQKSIKYFVVSVFLKKIAPSLERSVHWAIQQSWFARVNALCNLSRKKSREVTVHFRADF